MRIGCGYIQSRRILFCCAKDAEEKKYTHTQKLHPRRSLCDDPFACERVRVEYVKARQENEGNECVLGMIFLEQRVEKSPLQGFFSCVKEEVA